MFLPTNLGADCRRLVRFIRLSMHIATGLGIIALHFPHCSGHKRRRHIKNWSQKLVRIFGIRVEIHGELPDPSKSALILANHISWLDVFALNSAFTASFVAKSEVSAWPIIGRLCRGTGTLFINRDNKRDTARINEAIKTALIQGDHIAVFPEGTSTDGQHIRPFRSSLLQPAMECRALLQPACIQYLDDHGKRTNAAAYCDDISLGESVWKLLGHEGLVIRVHYLPPIHASQSMNRRDAAQAIEASIRTLHGSIDRILVAP